MAVPRKSTETARVILRGGYQYVILPKELELKGKIVRIYKQGDAVVSEPVIAGVKKWVADIGPHPLSKDFMADGRNQPPALKQKIFRT
jgi:virulence-associated protein VagC